MLIEFTIGYTQTQTKKYHYKKLKEIWNIQISWRIPLSISILVWNVLFDPTDFNNVDFPIFVYFQKYRL